MHLKLEKTLILFLNTLFLFPITAQSEDFSKAVASCNQALDSANPKQALKEADIIIEKNTKQAQALLCKGRALDALNNAEEAEKILLLSTDYATGFDGIIAHLVLGNFYRNHDNLNLALSQYQKSLQTSQQQNNQKFTRISHNLIGATYLQQKSFNEALKSYEAGEPLSMNDNERADSYERLASAYQGLNQLDKAIEFQLKASLMQKKSGTLDQYAEATLILGQLFTQSKDYQSAERTLERLLKFSQDNGGVYYEAKSKIYLAQNKYAQGDAAGAKSLFDEASSIANKIQANDLLMLIKASEKK